MRKDLRYDIEIMEDIYKEIVDEIVTGDEAKEMSLSIIQNGNELLEQIKKLNEIDDEVIQWIKTIKDIQEDLCNIKAFHLIHSKREL